MSDSLISAVVAVLAAIITTVGSVGFLTARAQRRRTNAEAEVALSDAGLRRVQAAEHSAELASSRADALQGAVDGLRLENEKIRRRQYAYETWAGQHQAWDAEAMDEVNARGGHLRPPPQLLMMDD